MFLNLILKLPRVRLLLYSECTNVFTNASILNFWNRSIQTSFPNWYPHYAIESLLHANTNPICINIATNIRLNLEWENKTQFWICAKKFVIIIWSYWKYFCRGFNTQKQWSFIGEMVNYFSSNVFFFSFTFNTLEESSSQTYWMIQNHLETERSFSILYLSCDLAKCIWILSKILWRSWMHSCCIDQAPLGVSP